MTSQTAQNEYSFLTRRKVNIFTGGLLVASLVFMLLIFTQKNFRVDVELLVVNNQQNTDFYSQFKSSEFLGKLFGSAVHSDRFIDAIIEKGVIDNGFLPEVKKLRAKKWDETVKVASDRELGKLHITVLENDQNHAVRIADGIVSVLVENNNLFRGGAKESVEVRLLSGPTLDGNPSLKDLVLSSALGFLLGATLTAILLVMKKRKKGAIQLST